MNIYEEIRRHFKKNGKRALMTEIARQTHIPYWKVYYFIKGNGNMYADELIRMMLALGYTIYAPDRGPAVYGGNSEKITQDIKDNVLEDTKKEVPPPPPEPVVPEKTE